MRFNMDCRHNHKCTVRVNNLKVLHALGMAEDMLCLARDDQLGRLLQDIETEKRNGKSK